MLAEIEEIQLEKLLKENLIVSSTDYMMEFGEENARAVFQEAIEKFKTTQRK